MEEEERAEEKKQGQKKRKEAGEECPSSLCRSCGHYPVGVDGQPHPSVITLIKT